MKNKCKITAALLSCMLLTACNSDRPFKATDSKKFKYSTVTSNLEAGLGNNSNVIYSSTFQLAWNDLKDNVVKGEIQLDKDVPSAKSLNKSLSTTKDFTSDTYVSLAGFQKDDIVNKINNALKGKYKKAAPQVQSSAANSDGVYIYGYMDREFDFYNILEDMSDSLIFRRGLKSSRVASIGISRFNSSNSDLKDRIKLVDYKSASDFIIRLKAPAAEDEIILSKVQPAQNLAATIDSIEKRIKEGKNEELQNGDYLVLPVINFDLSSSFEELNGKKLMNKGFEGSSIALARQDMRFKFDGRKTGLASKLKPKTSKGSGPKNRDLSFDQPYLLYIKEKDAKYPYFAIWVDNPEILVKK